MIPSQYSLGAVLRPGRWLDLSVDYSRLDWRKGTIENYYDSGDRSCPIPQKGDFGSKQQDIRNLRFGAGGPPAAAPLAAAPARRLVGRPAALCRRAGQAVNVSGYAAGVGLRIFQRPCCWRSPTSGKKPIGRRSGYFYNEPDVATHYSANLLKFSLTYSFGRIFKE